MPPKRFLVHFGESIDKATIREMCKLMELTAEETKLVLCRFCDRLTVEQAAEATGVSVDRQRVLVPILEKKIMSWIVGHFEFFNILQIRFLSKWVPPIDPE